MLIEKQLDIDILESLAFIAEVNEHWRQIIASR